MNDAAPPSTNDLLTAVLFGPNFRREHGFWRRLLTTEPFRRPDGGTPDERLALSYHRLRILNNALDSGARLAADPRALAALHEWLGPVDPALTTVAGIHYNLFLGSLLDHDAGTLRDLSDFLALRRVGTFLCTEVAHGNDAAAIETTATYDRERDGFVLHTPHAGAQKFMPNTSPAGGPKSGVVAARLLVDGADHGVFLFLVPLTDAHRTLPGVRVRRLPARMGSPVDHCLTSFDRRFVPRDALLAGQQGRIGEDGRFRSEVPNRRRRFLASIGRVTPGKISMSACAVGSARVTLAIAVRYAGPPDDLRIARRAADPGVRAPHPPRAAGRGDGHRLRDEPAAPQGPGPLGVGPGVRPGRGGTPGGRRQGVDHLAGARRHRRVPRTVRRPGAPGEQRHDRAVHRHRGRDHRRGRQPRRARQGRRRDAVQRHRPGTGPARPRRYGRSRLSRGLFAAVEDLWFARARERMAAAPPGDPLGRWNAASSAALRGVEAHAYRQADEAYAEAVVALPDGAARDRLTELRRLFALRWIARNSGDLLASGRLTADQVTVLPDAVEDAVAVVAEHTPALVESFALPERLMSDWPIAGPGYADVYDDPEGSWHRGRRAGIRGRAAEFRRPVCGSRRRPLREKVAALGTRGVLLAYWGTASVLSRWFEKPQVSVDESVHPKA